MVHHTIVSTSLPRPLASYKAILFDYGGVLVDLDKVRAFQAFDALGMDIRPYIGLYGQQALFGGLERGELTVAEFCTALREATGCTNATDAQIVTAWQQFTLGVPAERLALLWRLQRTHRLCLISNTSLIHWAEAEQAYLCSPHGAVRKLFTEVFLSYELGLEKPSPAIFELVLGRLGLTAQEVLLVDDSVANCEAAMALGIDSLQAAADGAWVAAFEPLLPTAQVHHELTADLASSIGDSVATIGFFDGVHSGHRALLAQVIRAAKAAGRASVAITFAQHPRMVVDATFQPALLLSDAARIAALATTGVDHVVVLPFDRAMAGLTAKAFMQEVLYDTLAVRQLFIGHDHRFGRGRTEGFADYVAYGVEMGMAVQQAERYHFGAYVPSSSAIRALLYEGEVSLAGAMLQGAYTLVGTVVTGRQVGRTIGFPTANVQLSDPYRLVPAAGVYLVRTSRGYGVMNIGHRPTFADTSSLRTLEVHLFDTSADLYGQTLSVSLLAYLRPEQRFASVEALVAQIQQDCATARELLANGRWRHVYPSPTLTLPLVYSHTIV
ncbi:MAG: riboflavin biosynthesis protein RibF [Bacteroidales bacterium]|nr:riboflavin biosynthesis protein RibF [Bacteroidales bacterium]